MRLTITFQIDRSTCAQVKLYEFPARETFIELILLNINELEISRNVFLFCFGKKAGLVCHRFWTILRLIWSNQNEHTETNYERLRRSLLWLVFHRMKLNLIRNQHKQRWFDRITINEKNKFKLILTSVSILFLCFYSAIALRYSPD